MRLTDQDVQALCNKHYIENNVPELLGMLEYVYAADPQTFLEIGVCYGGSLHIWEKVLAPGGVIIGLEHNPMDKTLQRLTGEIKEDRSNKGSTWQVESVEDNVIKLRSDREVYVVIGESCDPAVADTVESLLGGKKIDFWFHDGMHYGPVPVYDYHNFKHLISPNGLLCVADINDLTRQQFVDNSGCQALAREFPEPKDHPLSGHQQGMLMWRKQPWPEFDPAAIVKKHDLYVGYQLERPSQNGGGGPDPALTYTYPERD